MAIITIPNTGLWSTLSGFLNANFLELFNTKAEDSRVDALETELHRAEFMAISLTETAVSTDPNASSFVLGLEIEHNTGEFQLEADVGGIRNNSGRNLQVNAGLVSTHLVSTNATTKNVGFFSEQSLDKVTWVKNVNSARISAIAGTTEQYGSKSSEMFNWADGAVLRFKFFSTGAGVSLTPVSFLADGGTVSGPAFRWRLKEALIPH